MDSFWPADDAAAVVRSRFDRMNWQALAVAYRPVEVTTDESDLVIRFRYEGHPELFAVRFSLARMPEGPQTGEVCETLDDWAEEVGWVLDEELNTRMVDTSRADRRGRRGGHPPVAKPDRYTLSTRSRRRGLPHLGIAAELIAADPDVSRHTEPVVDVGWV